MLLNCLGIFINGEGMAGHEQEPSSEIVRTLCKTAVVPIPTTAHRPFIELPWGDC